MNSSELKTQVFERLLLTKSHQAEVARVDVSNVLNDVSPLLSPRTHESIVDVVMADIHGLGPLESFLHDESITDVLVTGDKLVWIERDGELLETNLVVSSSEIERLMERIVAPLGLHIDRSAPLVDARLRDGTRIHMVIPPIAVDGPVLTIRRFRNRPIALKEFCNEVTESILVDAVKSHKNLLISGQTGAGKTSLINALSFHIDRNERVVTIEDTAELKLSHDHVVRLESRVVNTEGVGEISLRHLVRNALRMRPDRIIVGEVRGAEAFDMLQALYTGHRGSMSTCHAHTPIDGLHRIETMARMSEVMLTNDALRHQIVSAFDLVVQVGRGRNGKRQIEDVATVGLENGNFVVSSLLKERL